MRRSPGIGHEPGLKRLAITSFIIHVFLISVLIIPFSSGEREFRSYSVNLVEPVRTREDKRDDNAGKARRRVPAKKKTVAKKKLPKKSSLPSEKSVKKAPLPDKESSEDSAEKIAKEIERLRAIKALSKKKEDKEKTREIEVVRRRISDQSITGSGSQGRGESIAPDSYYALITRKIWSEWIYPYLDTEGLEVIISIKIDRDGKVLSHIVEKTSGNMLFDSSAVKAISKASPLPPPHVEMEIGVRFYL
jgi:colicin import membrane protein